MHKQTPVEPKPGIRKRGNEVYGQRMKYEPEAFNGGTAGEGVDYRNECEYAAKMNADNIVLRNTVIYGVSVALDALAALKASMAKAKAQAEEPELAHKP